jgi:hypothetical protein
MNMEFNLVVYLVGVLLSLAFGLRGIGVFSNDIRYKANDVILVIIASLIFHWFGALVFAWGYDRPSEGHPDVI